MKSIITCDMEGVIQSMNHGAALIFGYNKNELIGKQRVSLFSPGEIVLQNVANWLSIASKDGVYNGKTIFISKKGDKINAKISITPTYSKGPNKLQTGYCGVTEVIDENIEVPIQFSTKLIKYLAITRMPFTSASILPIFVVAAYFTFTSSENIDLTNLVLCTLAILLAHLSTNMFNDYFDNIDGTDTLNNSYFQQISGGSRAIELGLISVDKTNYYAKILLLLSAIIGVVLICNSYTDNIVPIILIAFFGVFLGYFYTAPPIRLVARKGLGELSIFFAFGPLMTVGAGLVLFNNNLFDSDYFYNLILLGIPIGLLTTNILLINEFPDMESDMKTGKNHLVTVLGKKNSRYLYLTIFSLVCLFTLLLSFKITMFFLIPLIFSLFYGFGICRHLFKFYNQRSLVKANWGTIKLQGIYCSLIILSLFLSHYL